jgi:predicted nucleic acid-binding protein
MRRRACTDAAGGRTICAARHVDCIIAAVASRHGASLLVQDADLVPLCQIIAIQLDQTSRTI